MLFSTLIFSVLEWLVVDAGVNKDIRFILKMQLVLKFRTCHKAIMAITGHIVIATFSNDIYHMLVPVSGRSQGDIKTIWPRCRFFSLSKQRWRSMKKDIIMIEKNNK